jgi:uncharacterized repeat protein (TIGR03843 family)
MPGLEIPTILNVLQNGEISIKGEFVWGSNYTFLAEVCRNGTLLKCVYKPSRGERPLWDFPAASLARRETAAYVVSEALGWELVPPTVYRKNAPIGPGSLQLFIEHDPDLHYFNLEKVDRERLRPVVLFDLLINNADRKGSHLLFDQNHHLWLIDHGICFHAEDKLRTVIWDFAGQSIPQELRQDLRHFRRELEPATNFYKELQMLLTQKEIKALAARADNLLSLSEFPEPNPDERSFPWPLI